MEFNNRHMAFRLYRTNDDLCIPPSVKVVEMASIV